MSAVLTSFLATICAVVVYTFIGRCHFLHKKPHSGWLSAFGGAAVAYVFVYVLPKLAKMQHIIVDEYGSPPILGNHLAYIVAMMGFLVYYGSDWAAEFAESRTPRNNENSRAPKIRYLQTVSFAGYNLLVGHILADLAQIGPRTFILGAVALILHLVGTAHHLRERDHTEYERALRWIFAASIFLGWVLGTLWRLSAGTEALWFAFLAGAIIINVIWEELPSEQHGGFLPFLGGAVGYTVLIQLAIVKL